MKDIKFLCYNTFFKGMGKNSTLNEYKRERGALFAQYFKFDILVL